MPGCRSRTCFGIARGLAAWAPLYRLCSTPGDAGARLLAGQWWGARRGTYSDLGYILAGQLLERRSSQRLDSLIAQWLCDPLELHTVGYRPLADSQLDDSQLDGSLLDDGSRFARCSIDTAAEVSLARRLWRLEIDPLAPPSPGEAQDGNARFLGPSGHAGLFSSIEELAMLASAWLPRSWANRRLGLASESLRWALTGSGRRRFGWEARTTRNSAGPSLSPEAFGHTGFVGGSLWIEPTQRRISLLLGYRNDPFSDLNPVRRRFHGLAHS